MLPQRELLRPSVAGVYAPALVERSRSWVTLETLLRVAGVYAPALVERPLTRRIKPGSCLCVAGVYAPALVERPQPLITSLLKELVSPGFTPRPWLSEAVRRGIFAISERVLAIVRLNWIDTEHIPACARDPVTCQIGVYPSLTSGTGC